MAITVYFNFDTGNFHYKVDSDHQYFDSIVSLLKETYYCHYDSSKKEWYNFKAMVVKNSISDLRDYDTITISKEDKELLDDLMYPKDSTYKKIKSIPNKEWLTKHPPIKGKTPYEDYQLDTIRFCLNRNRFIQDIVPGAGKSYMMEAVLASMKNNTDKKVFWVCRLEGVGVTYYKILQFLSEYYTEDEVAIVDTDHREIEDYFNKKVIVTNYTTFRLSHEYYESVRNKGYKTNKKRRENKKKETGKKSERKITKGYIDFSKWGNPEDMVIILDEGQSIKNYDSLQSQAFHVYRDKFYTRGILSGSLGYSVMDYYSICKFLVPESVPYTYSEFRNYLSTKSSYYKKINPTRAKEFKEKVLNDLQISYDEKVLDLPPFEEKEIFIMMNEKMKRLYRSFIDKSVTDLREKKERELSDKDIDNYFMYLNMFTSDPSLVEDKLGESWDISENPKVEIVESMLDRFIKDEGRKVVLWCSYPRTINKLKVILKKYNPIVIHGDEKTSINRSDRDGLVEEFRTSQDRNLLICSYVLNSSIDLYEATREIYWDNNTNNDTRNQSKKRIWRLGQKERVEAYYLLFDSSIDIYVYYEILLRKDKVRSLMTAKGELSSEDYNAIFNAKVNHYWKE